ncbi:hypothetical protein HDU97_005327 [Phlyctochytrium planicorne]|nr:hypothetical protein HDU97_005327 [Phlyctochytrium planicorne]
MLSIDHLSLPSPSASSSMNHHQQLTSTTPTPTTTTASSKGMGIRKTRPRAHQSVSMSKKEVQHLLSKLARLPSPPLNAASFNTSNSTTATSASAAGIRRIKASATFPTISTSAASFYCASSSSKTSTSNIRSPGAPVFFHSHHHRSISSSSIPSSSTIRSELRTPPLSPPSHVDTGAISPASTLVNDGQDGLSIIIPSPPFSNDSSSSSTTPVKENDQTNTASSLNHDNFTSTTTSNNINTKSSTTSSTIPDDTSNNVSTLSLNQTVDISIRILYGIFGPHVPCCFPQSSTTTTTTNNNSSTNPSCSLSSNHHHHHQHPSSQLGLSSDPVVSPSHESLKLEAQVVTTFAHAALLNLPFCKSAAAAAAAAAADPASINSNNGAGAHPLLYALLLVYRMVRGSQSSSTATPGSAHSHATTLPASLRSPTRLLMASLMLAEAQLSDRQTSTLVWSKLHEMTLETVGLKGSDALKAKVIAGIKRDALMAVGFASGVSLGEYSAWLAALKKLLQQSFGVASSGQQQMQH